MNSTKYFSKYDAYGNVGVEVKETGHNYDFIASIVNNSPNTLSIYVDDLEGCYKDAITIPPNEWVGLEADEEGYAMLSMIKDGDFCAEYCRF